MAESTTAGRLAGLFGPDQLAGIETGLAAVYRRWLALVAASVRAPLVLRDPTIDLDASDIEVYERKKKGELRRGASAAERTFSGGTAEGSFPDGGQSRPRTAPPSMPRVVPLMKPACCEHRKAMT